MCVCDWDGDGSVCMIQFACLDLSAQVAELSQ